jgi:hypothetical protein
MYDMYLSVVVNNKNEIVGKIGIRAIRNIKSITTESIQYKTSDGKVVSKYLKKDAEVNDDVEVVLTADVKIIKETIEEEERFPFLASLISGIISKKEPISRHYHGGSFQNFGNTHDFNDFNPKHFGNTQGTFEFGKHKKGKDWDIDKKVNLEELNEGRDYTKIEIVSFLTNLLSPNSRSPRSFYSMLYEIQQLGDKKREDYLESRLSEFPKIATDTFGALALNSLINLLEECIDYIEDYTEDSLQNGAFVDSVRLILTGFVVLHSEVVEKSMDESGV